jgi:hypothetical protein
MTLKAWWNCLDKSFVIVEIVDISGVHRVETWTRVKAIGIFGDSFKLD